MPKLQVQFPPSFPKWLYNNVFYSKSVLSHDSEDEEVFDSLDDAEKVEKEKANVISSEIKNNGGATYHKVFLDLDLEHHYYVPSSTPGHGHLYLNVPLQMFELLDLMETLERYEIVQKGWVKQLKERGANTFRLPWVSK